MIKENILVNTSSLFYSKGFKTVTMDDIANELAMSKKTLYELFGSKENLIADVINYNYIDIQEYFKNVQSKNLDAIEELIILKNYVDNKFNSINHQTSLFQLQRYYGKVYKKVFMTQNHKIIERLECNFIKGKDQGLYRESIEPKLYARLLIDLQNFLKSTTDTGINIEQQYYTTQIHWEVFIRGILSILGLKRYELLRNTK